MNNKIIDFFNTNRNNILQNRVSDADLTLFEFLNFTTEVVLDKDLNKAELLLINECEKLLTRLKNIYFNDKVSRNSNDYLFFDSYQKGYLNYQPVNNDIAFIFLKDLIMLYKGKICGCIYNQTRYVKPEFRGMGFGKEMVLFTHSHPELNLAAATHYSYSGFKTRCKAYKEIKKNVGILINDQDIENEYNSLIMK